MKSIIIPLLLIFSLLTVGCTTDTGIIMECTEPLIQKGDGCCMDADRNGICDIDEAEPAEEIKEAESKENIETEKEVEPEPHIEKEEKQEAEIELKNTKEDAEKIGKLFTERWQLKQYNTMYILFTNELKEKKTATEFTAIMELDAFYKKINKAEFKGANIIDDNNAELIIVAHTNIQEIDLTGATLKFEDSEWKVNTFVDVFELPLYDAACSGYRYNNQYKMSDCAYDLAKKVNDAQYCDISECHYVDCLRDLGKPSGITQEAEQCKICQPPMKTINECILDVAIKYDKVSACNIIDDSKYSDKYCVCYGGFAKHKGTFGYCNMIEDEKYKDLCMKGFEGGYC